MKKLYLLAFLISLVVFLAVLIIAKEKNIQDKTAVQIDKEAEIRSVDLVNQEKEANNINQKEVNISSCNGIKEVTDTRDNSIYQTVEIGGQCWLNRNLNIGKKIVGNKEQADNAIIEKYCYLDNDINCDSDGGLFSWNEAMQYSNVNGSQGICPNGWHIPSDAEWFTLEKSLTEKQSDCNETRKDWGCYPGGDKLKHIKLCNQFDKAYCGSSGFNAIYAGDRNDYAENIFTYKGDTALFWTSTQYNLSSAWERHVYAKWNNGIHRGIYTKANAFSIRCIKDR